MKSSDLKPGDYNPYYQPYIEVLGDVKLLPLLEAQLSNFPKFIQAIPGDRWHYRYGEGKWSIAEVLLHIIDAERVFQYRAMRMGRGDKTPLPGFDENAYVPESNAALRNQESIIEEYQAVRRASIALFRHFDNDTLLKKGLASDSAVSVGALGFLIAGHQKHHRNIIRERYLD